MASRFGGVSPAQTYATKVRWLVGCLVSIIIVLAAAFIIVAQNSGPAKDGQAVATEQAPATGAAGKAEIVVALGRIEEGAALRPELFSWVSMDESQVPMGAVRKKDLPQIQEKFASRLINPNVPLVSDDITTKRSYSALSIPAGYRAVTIVVDRRAGVEGFARPNSRVDVLWSFVRDGKQQVATIVRSVKILSVGGMTANVPEGSAPPPEQAGDTTVTLLATEYDAKKIELARTAGAVSLSLVGDVEELSKTNEVGPVTMNDLLQEQDHPTAVGPKQEEEPSHDGVVYSVDPKTGKQVRYVLNQKKKWVLDTNY